MIQVTINNQQFTFDHSQTILAACAQVGIRIPTLCYEKSVGAIASCRVCVVEVVGRSGLVTACNTPIIDGMQIITNSAKVNDARKTILELLLADHNLQCLDCAREPSCRLRRFAVQYGALKGTFAPTITANSTSVGTTAQAAEPTTPCAPIQLYPTVAAAADQQQAETTKALDTATDMSTTDTSTADAPATNMPATDTPIVDTPTDDTLATPTADGAAAKEVAATKDGVATNCASSGKQHILRDQSKCIQCGRCVRVCKNMQQVGVLGTIGRGFTTTIGCAFGAGLESTNCIACGQCVAHCPTGALVENADLPALLAKLRDPNVHCIVATAPSVRVSIGEGFGLPAGTNAQGKMVTALRRLGFAKVFDLDFAADLTIMQESAELLERLQSGKNLPQFTSCCPGWVNYVEQVHPELIPNLSTAKSPMGMFAAIAKTYYAQKQGLDPQNIYLVMLMPCIAKYDERLRDDIQDVDMVLTTRLAIRLLKQQGIDLANLPDSAFDDPLSLSSGAGLMFGTSGGVCEAALRNLEGQLPRPVKAIVVSGIANAEKLIRQVQAGTASYDFIEVMACPGGCVNGGGQPCDLSLLQDNRGHALQRAATIKQLDQAATYRKASDNPAIKQLYAEFLGTPASALAQKLLHTQFHNRA